MQTMSNHELNEDEQIEPTEDEYETPHKGKREHKPRRNKKWGNNHRSTQLSMRDVLKQFVACGRCGYFLAGYRVLHGVEALEEAANDCTDGWLELIWDQPTRQLIYKSYGVRPEPDMFYFDICCEECQRRLVYEEEEEGVPSEMFRIDVKLK